MLKENIGKKFKIKDLPKVERPREKLISNGSQNLKDEGLLAFCVTIRP